MGTVTRSGGHALGSLSHAGPLHHSCFSSVTGSLRLATSAGLPLVAMYLHVMSPCSLIFRTRFATNCLKSPFPRIQCSATLLSSQLLIPIIPMFDNSRFCCKYFGIDVRFHTYANLIFQCPFYYVTKSSYITFDIINSTGSHAMLRNSNALSFSSL